MKIIFLDFDGVITTPLDWRILDEKIAYVKRIVDATGAQIVISSSWRCGSPTNLETTKKYILEEYDSEMVHWLLDNCYDVTPRYGSIRGDEIKKWLSENEVEEYVILDDDHDFLNEQLFHFVQTDYQFGITEIEAERAIKILNRQYIHNVTTLNYTLKYEALKKYEGLPNMYDEILKYNDLCKDLDKI